MNGKSRSLSLDRTPSGEEEERDFPDPEKASGAAYYDVEEARIRIDALSRLLAWIWTGFLIIVITLQGLQVFHLRNSEFIAVISTTTVAIFGFLVIVAKYVFNR